MMTTRERYYYARQILEEFYHIDFKMNFFEMNSRQYDPLNLMADLMKLKPKNGKSPARHLFDQCNKYDLPF